MSRRACAWIVALLSVFLVAAPADIAFAQPNVQGQWTTMSSTMPINPIHVALLPNGKLLIIAGSGNCPPSQSGCPSGPPYGPSNSSGALLFDPVAGNVVNQFTINWDMFCNDMAILQDGRVLIAGGTIQYDPYYGSPQASIFDPSTNTFSDIANMAHGRWYPTTLTLGDGRIMTFSGFNETGGTNTSVEYYTPGSGWSQEYDAGWTPDMYPRMHLLPSGKVFYSSGQTISKLFDPSTNTWNTNFATTNYPYQRTYGTSVLLPLTPANNYDPKIIIMGGDNPATDSTEIIDMGSSSPAWQWGPPMSAGRIEMNAVILPNGKVLAVGGSVNDEDVASASLQADLYDPASNTFSPAGTNAYPRLYHSTALLLPDGTVWLAGGNPNRGSYVPQMEIYKPAYLFNSDGSAATRPTMTNVPASVQYGQSFNLTTPDAANIGSVVLVHNATVTHAFDKDQREVGLSFTAGNGTLTVTGPPNGNIAPPGYYMLFILNKSGVPSMANFVQVSQPAGDFSVSATPSSASVTAGSSTSFTVSVTPSNAFNGTVNLSVSGLPSGATGTFSPSSVSGGQSSTLTVNTTSSTPAGTSTLTITGTSGALTHTAQVSLVVSASSGGGGGSGGSTGSPVSDEFNESSLNTGLWAVLAPVGGTAAVNNGELVVSVPAGSNHDPLVPAKDAVQVVQSISNADFDVAVKIDSTLPASAVYSGMGLMVEGDANNYIRYELWASGSIALSAYTVTSGNQTTQINLSPFSNYVVPTYLRLKRSGTTYTAYWSTDGSNWNQAGSFTDSLTVTGLAPYAFNYNATPSQAPAVNAQFDWFHNLAATTSTAATPTFSPASGTSFSSTQSVTIADSTSNATIYYTTDGSTPTTSSAVYSGPITLSASATVKAIATASGMTQSAVGSASYTLTTTQSVAATPTFSPASGTSFSSTLSVTIADSTPNATIYYTTDGSTPSTSSAVYSGPITLSASATVKAIATASGMTQSAVGSASYTFTGGGSSFITQGSYYRIINQASGACIDDSGNLYNGAPLTQWQCWPGNTNQEWWFKPSTTISGDYTIGDLNNTSLIWTVSSGGTADNTNVEQDNSGTAKYMQWSAKLLSSGYYEFIDANSGKCLTVPGGSKTNGLQLQISTCTGSPSQSFVLGQISNTIAQGSWYEVISNTSGDCVTNSGTTDGSPLLQQVCGSLLNQEWQFVSASGGYQAVHSGSTSTLVWDDSGWGTNNGNGMQLWTSYDNSNQHWTPATTSDGMWSFTVQTSGMCLDNSGSTSNGTQMIQWTCYAGNTNQEYELDRVR